ncbi:hypothetical protein BDN72DRAFT_875405 [Pluteus cervinus]|uniref:Uncharacterized protein n=1 Tax=Pluteus cervinus TaxID=181527 RepID=A0ACD3BAX5_9AGAR|nr:hypothetical protein BDN72DRAFT_875405 [Pluteus cervinus]
MQYTAFSYPTFKYDDISESSISGNHKNRSTGVGYSVRTQTLTESCNIAIVMCKNKQGLFLIKQDLINHLPMKFIGSYSRPPPSPLLIIPASKRHQALTPRNKLSSFANRIRSTIVKLWLSTVPQSNRSHETGPTPRTLPYSIRNHQSWYSIGENISENSKVLKIEFFFRADYGGWNGGS